MKHTSLKRNTHSIRFLLDGVPRFGSVDSWIYEPPETRDAVFALVNVFSLGTIQAEAHRYLHNNLLFPQDAICPQILVPLRDILNVVILLHVKSQNLNGFPCYQLVKLVYDTDDDPYEADNANNGVGEIQEIM